MRKVAALTLSATSRTGRGRVRHVELVAVVLGAARSAHGARATEAQHCCPVRRVVVHREEQVAQQRAVDATWRARAGAVRLHPHVSRHNHVLLVIQVQLAERRVRSRACHVDAEVVRARTAVRGAHAAKNRLAEGTYEGVLVVRVGVRATETESAHSASPSVARTCSAMRLNSPLQRCCARFRAILDSLTGWAGWYARRQ